MGRKYVKMIDTRLMAEAGKQSYEKFMKADRPGLSRHNSMQQLNRASQFAPFAELSGLVDAFQEEERDTEEEKMLSDEVWSELNYTLQALLSEDGQPMVKVTYFQPDVAKDGGIYKEVSGKFLGVDRFNRELSLSGGVYIYLDRISAIKKVEKIIDL